MLAHEAVKKKLSKLIRKEIQCDIIADIYHMIFSKYQLYISDIYQ